MIESKDDFGLEATETCDAAVIGFDSSMLEPSKSPVEAEVNTEAFGVSALLDDAGDPGDMDCDCKIADCSCEKQCECGSVTGKPGAA